MAKTVLQLQDHIARLESELELSKFLNKGVLQTNIEYKARIADLEYENDVLRKAESRLASTEEELEQAQAKAEKLEERLIEEEDSTQAALERESVALKKLAAAERSRGTMTFQDKLKMAEWEDVVRELEDEKDDWRHKYEQLSSLLTPVISVLNDGKSINLDRHRLRQSTNGVPRTNSTVRSNGVGGKLNGQGSSSRSLRTNSAVTFPPPFAGQRLTSPPANADRHSSPIRQKRKTGGDHDDILRPKSTPDRVTKASRLSGQQGAKKVRQRRSDDWSDVDVKSEPESDSGEFYGEGLELT